LLDEKYFDFHCPMAQKQPWIGNKHEWFWICGTDWTNGGETSHVEYILVVWGICLFGLNLYAQAYCYPRTLYEQFIELREFPRYYKTDNPDAVIVAFRDHRINEETGKEEFLVERRDGVTKEDLGKTWEAKDDLMQDAVGPVYAERGGLFGVLHDTYGKSTYDRLRIMTSLEHSEGRLALIKRNVAGIRYDKGYPTPLSDVSVNLSRHAVENGHQAEEEDDNVRGTSSTTSAKKRGRSKTPSKSKHN